LLGAVYVDSPVFMKNSLFALDRSINRDNCLFHYSLLKRKLGCENIDLVTLDMVNSSKVDFMIFADLPMYPDTVHKIVETYRPKRKYLMLWESELIKPQNWVIENHRGFDGIFTWSKRYKAEEGYIHFQWPNRIPAELHFTDPKHKAGFVLIASNRLSDVAGELYTERRKAIRWFEKMYPEEFSLYGKNWDAAPIFTNPQFLLKLRITRKILKYRKYRTLCGPIVAKSPVLSPARFSICYENAKGIPDYVTEKIIDSLISGTIPIYLGVQNIESYVDQRCFIDKRKFPRYRDLYAYCKSITDQEYRDIQESMKSFLSSEKGRMFSSEKFAEIVAKRILTDMAI